MNEYMENLKVLRAEGIFFDACPDDVYDPCPCGCGSKLKFVLKNNAELNKHINTFISNMEKP